MAEVRDSSVTRADIPALVDSWVLGFGSRWTRGRYRRDLGLLANWLQVHHSRGLLEAGPQDIISLGRALAGRRHDLNQQPHPLRRHSTIATKATAWSSFYRHCIGLGLLQDNPVAQARATEPGMAHPRHAHHQPARLDAEALRAVVVAAHRDPWLGGSLGVALIGLVLATGWRSERIAGCRLTEVPAAGSLPAAVRDYLDAWIAERPAGPWPELFRDRSGLWVITAVELARLIHRCADRAGLGEHLTAAQLSSAARRCGDLELPGLDELRRIASAPEQLALPADTPGRSR